VGTGHGHFTWNVCHTDGRCGTFKGRHHTESTQVPLKSGPVNENETLALRV
jgi:hypothetical protein